MIEHYEHYEHYEQCSNYTTARHGTIPEYEIVSLSYHIISIINPVDVEIGKIHWENTFSKKNLKSISDVYVPSLNYVFAIFICLVLLSLYLLYLLVVIKI